MDEEKELDVPVTEETPPVEVPVEEPKEE